VVPVGEVYRLYDLIVGQIQAALPSARLLIATGLHQDPHPELTFYWRLKDHAAFLRKIGAPFERVDALMSRDFIVHCATDADALKATEILASAKADGVGLFEIENRGRDLFIMLTWPRNISSDFVYTTKRRTFTDLHSDVAFVAIKNGQHNGIGYFIDTGARNPDTAPEFPLKELPSRICRLLGAPWQQVA
jgi:hypothetical protein